jgi:membrane glycosyltransferase
MITLNSAYIPIYVALITLFAAGLTGLFQYVLTRANAKKANADAAKVIAEAATALLVPYREEIAVLRIRLKELEEENDELRASK